MSSAASIAALAFTLLLAACGEPSEVDTGSTAPGTSGGASGASAGAPSGAAGMQTAAGGTSPGGAAGMQTGAGAGGAPAGGGGMGTGGAGSPAAGGNPTAGGAGAPTAGAGGQAGASAGAPSGFGGSKCEQSYLCVDSCDDPTGEPPCGAGFLPCPEGQIPTYQCPGWPSSGHAGAGGEGGTTGAGGAGGGPISCGGLHGLACPDGMFCDFPDNHCGGFDEQGECRPKPGPNECVLPESPVPTCGCDGKVYDAPCKAEEAGVDVSYGGGCEAPAGTFACGAGFCTVGAAYCRRDVSDVASFPDGYACVPVPGPCQIIDGLPNCACVAEEPCASFACDDAGGGAVTVTCPGG